MADAQTRALARRLHALEQWRLQSKQPNLGFSTIEGGALQVVDEDDTVRSVVGQQEDGTYTVVDVNGPPPPTPLAPTVSVQPGLLVVSSYGLTVDGGPWPMDFRRLDVHVSAVPGFTPDLTTRIGEFSVEGGAVSLALPEGPYYVKLVAVSTSGTKSPVSDERSGTVPAPAQGSQGVPGPPGADGQSAYTWLKYADTPTTGMSDDPTGKAYLGLAYNKTTAIESTDYADYSWSLIEGPPGDPGPAGDPGLVWRGAWVSGATYAVNDAVTNASASYRRKVAGAGTTAPGSDATNWEVIAARGAAGAAGLTWKGAWAAATAYVVNDAVTYNGSSYRRKVAGTTAGNPATDTTNWDPVALQGSQGVQGIPGPAGADGTPRYTWVKYADTPTTGMSDLPTGKTYIGFAFNQTTAVESSVYTDYQWSLIQGPQGIQGPAGADGQPTYTWLKYADSPTTGMSDSPVGKTYMGIAYNKTTATESTTYTDYEWSLIQGPQGPPGNQGVPGPAGADGQPTYTWVKYADNASGGGMSDLPAGKTYIGLAYNKTTATESTVATDYQWALIQGEGRVYRTDSPPTGLGPDDVATWYDTDNGNLQSYWDGNSWEPMPLGAEATAEDVIAGKKVPLNARVELQWGVPNPNQEPQFPYASLEPLYVADTNGDQNNCRGLAVDETGKYVQFEMIQDPVTGNYYYRRVYIDPADGSVTRSPIMDIFSALLTVSGGQQVNKYNPQGLTKIGTTWYVLSWSLFTGLYLFSFDQSWNLLSQKQVGPTDGNGDKYHGLSNDGTNLLILKDMDAFTGGTQPTVIEKHNPATWGTGTGTGTAPVSSLTVTTTNTELFNPIDILPLANYSFGAGRYVMLASVGDWFPEFRAIIINSAGAEVDRYKLYFGQFSTGGGTGIRWNATTSRFEFAGSYGTIWRNTPNTSDKNVWLAYTLHDSIADPDTHESTLSPVTTAVTPVPRWNGISMYADVPDVDDVQAPDTFRVYARVGDATKPAAADMDAQTSVVQPFGLAYQVDGSRFVDNPVNGGAAPPPVSSFPVGPSGEVVSELGGLILRGDGTIDAPYLTRKLQEVYDGRYAPKGHDHPELEGRFSALQVTSADHGTSLLALDARLDTLETPTAAIQLTPTMAGVSGHAFFIKQIAPGTVGVSGYIDYDGTSAARQDTGMRIPAGMRPLAQVIISAPTVGTTNTYRYFFGADGVIEFEQSGTTVSGPFESISGLWFTA